MKTHLPKVDDIAGKLRTFGRWDDIAGKLPTFQRWKMAEWKENADTDAQEGMA